MNRVALILAAGEHERWKGEGPKHLVDVAGEPLLCRTQRQLKALGWPFYVVTHLLPELDALSERVFTPGLRRWICETLMSTTELWRDRTVVLLGDVIWPDGVLEQVLADKHSPRVFGNFCEIYAVGFDSTDADRVASALQRAVSNVRRPNEGKLWHFYRALSGLKDLNRHQWDNQGIFLTIPSVGTPAGAMDPEHAFTRDFDQIGDYWQFLEEQPWARTDNNWPHSGKRTLSAIVTGTGRCGTGFIAQLLSSAGLPCGHEAIFRPTSYEQAMRQLWNHPELRADSSWMAAPFLDQGIAEGAVIIHLIRHPRQVIESAYGIGSFQSENLAGFSQFNLQYLPSLRQFDNPLDKIGHRYAWWNQMIEDKATGRDYVRFCIDLQEPIELLRELDKRGLVDLNAIDTGRLYSNQSYNSRGTHRRNVSLKDFDPKVTADLRSISERYEYEWTDN